MLRRPRVTVRLAALASLAAVFGAGCNTQDASAPAAPHILSDLSSPPSPQDGFLVVCKNTPTGTSGSFELDVFLTNPDGSSGGSAGVVTASGSCNAVETQGTSLQQSFTVTSSENLVGVSGWSLGSVTVATTSGTTTISGAGAEQTSSSPATNPASCSVSSTAGCVLVFNNVPTTTTGSGKTFSIGPSSMEGAILIANGDTVNGGYSFSFKNGSHAATSVTVGATVSLTGPCVGGGPASDTFTFPLQTMTYAVSAGNTQWLPTGDQNSALSWQGAVAAAGVCGGVGKLDASHGAVFTATVSQNPPTGSLLQWRFKYRDPAAKGKPNTNCLDTKNPNEQRADVCGASWSQTVTDP